VLRNGDYRTKVTGKPVCLLNLDGARMTRKQLGKIQKAMVGIAGYQDCMLGVGFVLGGDGWGVHTGWSGSWCPGIVDPSENAKWSESDRSDSFDKAMRLLGETLRKAKKTDVSQLEGVPVEATFDGITLVSWRVLEEVL
jgi:hypothetical protein